MKPEEPETLREAAKLGMRDWPIFAIYTKKGQPTAAVSKLVEPVLLDDFIRRTIAETTTKKKFSLWQMAKSFADTVIGSFIDLMFARNPIASKPVQAVRASICEPCYDRKDKSCGVCGCLLKAKQMVRASSCPKGLW